MKKNGEEEKVHACAINCYAFAIRMLDLNILVGVIDGTFFFSFGENKVSVMCFYHRLHRFKCHHRPSSNSH